MNTNEEMVYVEEETTNEEFDIRFAVFMAFMAFIAWWLFVPAIVKTIVGATLAFGGIMFATWALITKLED